MRIGFHGITYLASMGMLLLSMFMLFFLDFFNLQFPIFYGTQYFESALITALIGLLIWREHMHYFHKEKKK